MFLQIDKITRLISIYRVFIHLARLYCQTTKLSKNTGFEPLTRYGQIFSSCFVPCWSGRPLVAALTISYIDSSLLVPQLALQLGLDTPRSCPLHFSFVQLGCLSVVASCFFHMILYCNFVFYSPIITTNLLRSFIFVCTVYVFMPLCL